ncbi:hypothetical protein DRQ07_09770 [candidate division KSB1 bacterium]|nr:MAG: hypothetical protein DRQ07_09770 [candidate division KSB1 bacterium]
MGQNNFKEHLINILTKALEREIAAYNYYVKSAVNAGVKEAEILFTHLAEEERNHQQLIRNEIKKVKQLIELVPDNETFSSKRIKYAVPHELTFKKTPGIGNFDIAAVSLPLNFISGDLLDIHEAGSSLSVLLCDVMGHGVSPSMVGAKIREVFGGLLEEVLQTGSVFKTDTVINRMNKKAVEMCRDKCRFITAVHTIISSDKKKLFYTSAGHDTPIIIRKNGQCITLEKTDLVLGADIDAEYSSTAVNLNSGDIVAVFSDGITEITEKNDKTRMFGKESIVRAIRKFSQKSAGEIVRNIFDLLIDFSGKNEFSDDMSLAVIKIEE